MRKSFIFFISLVVCLFIASQALTDQQITDSRQSANQGTGNSALPGVLMLLLGDLDKYEISINITGQGSGQVHVSPFGTEFDPGTVVTLTAEADLGSVFIGWGGACGGTSLTCQVTMSQTRTVTAMFAVESTVPRANQAVLGPLAGATIRAYRLGNLSNPIEGPFLANNSINMEAAGTFGLLLSGISNNEWILVTATGGWDIDADDNGVIDAIPTRNYGMLHALATAAQWRQGGLKVNALTDMAWRYSQAWVGHTGLTELEKRLNELSRVFLLEKLSGQGEIGYNDLLTFVPHNAGHKAKLSFDYSRILAAEGFAARVHAGKNESELHEALSDIFGAHLSFTLPDNLESEILVRLSAFGRGRVASADNKLVVDSETAGSALKPQAPYTRDGNPVMFTATPTADTEILGWSGCDWVSEDQAQCRVGLASNRQVQVDFGYMETVVSPQFVDLFRAMVNRSGNTLTVTVDENDEELMARMADIAEDWFVVGMAGQDPFLLQVTDVLSHQNNVWQLTTTQASLEDVIIQGTGTLKRAMTHGDLAPGSYTAQTRTETGEVLPVRLLPSKDHNDRVFRLQIGEIPDSDYVPKSPFTGSLEIKDPGGNAVAKVDGEVDVEIEIDTAISFAEKEKWYEIVGELEHFKFVPTVNLTPEIKVTASKSFELLDKKKKIHSFQFAGIHLQLGPVPVILFPNVDIYIGIKGKVEAALTMKVSYSMTASAGMIYDKNTGWEPIHGFERNWKFDEPNFNASASLKGYLAAEPTVLIYKITGPALGVEASVTGAVKAGVDPNCFAALDWGLWGGIAGKMKWKGNEEIWILGKYLAKIEVEIEFFKWERKFLGGVLNGCGIAPPTLFLAGNDISTTIIQGISKNVQTTYILTNKGNHSLPWSIATSSGRISATPSSGSLDPDASVEVTVTVNNVHQLDRGEHSYRLDFKNDFQGPIGQSGLGTTDRTARVNVIMETFPAPTITSTKRHTATTASLDWTYPANSSHLLAGFDIWYTLDSTLESGWTRIGTATRTQRSISLLGVPQQTFYVTVEAFGADPTVQTAQAEAKAVRRLGDEPNPAETWTEPVTGMDFVWVPGGCYMMGCGAWTDSCNSNEYPLHEVCLDGFWMGKYEVTQGQWTQIMGSNPSYFKSGDNYPVEQVSWNDVHGFITQLNSHGASTFRLPTEAEWEYAARSGGRAEKYAGGDDLSSLGWYYDNSGTRTNEVGSKAPNDLGIYDMSGNVWEWVSDRYGENYYSVSPRNNPQGPATGADRVLRGGSWDSLAQSCRAAFRSYYRPGNSISSLGFRLAYTPGQ